jgi:hypothetical protein
MIYNKYIMHRYIKTVNSNHKSYLQIRPYPLIPLSNTIHGLSTPFIPSSSSQTFIVFELNVPALTGGAKGLILLDKVRIQMSHQAIVSRVTGMVTAG